MKRGRWIAIALLAFAGAMPARAEVVLQESFEAGIGSKWRPVKFKGRTEYSIALEGTNHVLQARARSAASGLGVELHAPTGNGLVLKWRWKIDQVPVGATETKKSSFDHTARLFVSHKKRLGVPTTLNYVWASAGEVGEIFNHPSSKRSKFIILQSGDAHAGEWRTEARDVAADWERAFGTKMPKTVSAVGLMTDSDGTRTEVVGMYDDIVLQTGTLDAEPE